MAKLIPAAERLKMAHELIQKARDLPVPAGMGNSDMGYIGQVKGYLREARELVQFIPKTPTATSEMKADVKRIFEETEKVDRELMRLKMPSRDG
jgi:hypothetical protein